MLAFLGILIVFVLTVQYPVISVPLWIILFIWAASQEGSGSSSGGGGSSYGGSSYGRASYADRQRQERRAENRARSNERRAQQQADFRAYRSSMNNVMKRAADSGVNFGGSRNRSSRSSRSSSRSGSFGGGRSRGGGAGRKF